MNAKIDILNTFKKQKAHNIVWQPRLEHWYAVNKKRNTLPRRYKESELFEIYDDLDASVRYFTTEVVGDDYISYEYSKKVKIKHLRNDEMSTVIYETPIGDLTETRRFAEWGCSWHFSEFLIKKVQDFKILEYILKSRTALFKCDFFREAERRIADKGIVQFYWFDRAPIQSMFLLYMGYENAIYALYDYPKEMKNMLNVIEEAQDGLFQVLEDCPVIILNFPENIDSNIDPQPIFREYLLPNYIKRVEQLHKVNKYCHIHVDGSVGSLLSLINKTGCDGIEGLTSLPQGDISINNLKTAISDTILLDGIPAIMFLPNWPEEDLINFTWQILQLFYPNIILGISDELPPDGDIERVRRISGIVKDFNISHKSLLTL